MVSFESAYWRMVFNKEGFTRVIQKFLSASVKNASEIEGCWSEMQRCINNMDHVVQSFARQEQNKVDMEELPQPVDVGSGKCSSTITEPGGCGATIKSREEILQLKKNKKKKWSGVKLIAWLLVVLLHYF